MDIREICAEWLEKNGYDGLCTGQCSCEISNLIPCEVPSVTCEAGYKIPCPGPEECSADGDCPWHISPTKPENPC